MSVNLRTSDIVIETITYLENELNKFKLDKEKGILYFKILLDNEENNIVERPFFTFKLEDFDGYLDFFKDYNLIDQGMNPNTFMLSERNWKGPKVTYSIPNSKQDSFLDLLESHLELSSYIFSA